MKQLRRGKIPRRDEEAVLEEVLGNLCEVARKDQGYTTGTAFSGSTPAVRPNQMMARIAYFGPLRALLPVGDHWAYDKTVAAIGR